MLALLDAQSELVVELVPCECGHAQERSLLPELLERIRAETVIVADRNFCRTKFLFGLFSSWCVLCPPTTVRSASPKPIACVGPSKEPFKRWPMCCEVESFPKFF